MLEIQKIRSNKEFLIEQLLKIRKTDVAKEINEIFQLDEKKRETQQLLDSLSANMNTLSANIGKQFKAGNVEKANQLKSETGKLKEEIKQLKADFIDLENQLKNRLYEIPNVPNESVPSGSNEADNEVVFQVELSKNEYASFLPHWELCEKYDLIDFELGVKITGAGFPVYKGKGARLQRALIQFFLNEANDNGYGELLVPHLVNESSGYGTGQLPDKEGQMYHVQEDNLYLIPTAEVPLTNIYRDRILDIKDLPICMTGYTPCFRREAGSYGANVRGLNRLHQFDKVEIVRIENPEFSSAALKGMIEHVKNILGELELPYRIIKLCGGDLGFTSALTYDFEVYSTVQKRWLEISSVSTFKGFQAERLKIRYKDNNGKKASVHTLNGSSLAIPRVVAGLLENFQTDNGIIIPNALVNYTGFEIID